MNRSTLRRSTLSAALLTIAMAATACGGSDDPSGNAAMPSHDMNSMSTASATTTASSPTAATPAAGRHNDADVTFVTGMIPHHAQAVVMADMANSNATNAQLKQLATSIKAAQAPEITTMAGWLAGWGKPIPTSGHHGMEMGEGMMSDSDLEKLDGEHGADFDRMWLKMMIDHHDGAIAMATTELETGVNTDATTLARSIITSQTAEITRMRKLEASLS